MPSGHSANRISKKSFPDIETHWNLGQISPPGEDRSGVKHWDWGAIRVGRLPRANSPEEYEIHLAALEWGLDPAILINKAEDIQARKHWQGLLEPFEHQVKNLITFCRRAPVALIADDVGLGKTISAGLILSELSTRGKVGRALIIAPKILGPQWQEELKTKFRIPSSVGAGAELTQLINKTTDNVITTYHSARNRIPDIESAGFDMLILDEAHHLRNLYGTQKPPIIATALQEALKKRAFRYVLMLTATPIHNRLWDIYSLIELLTSAKGHANPLGDENDFNLRYIADGKSSARVLVPGRQDEFRQHLSQYLVRTRRADCGLSFPDRTVLLERANPQPGELELFEVMNRVFENLNALTQISLAQALMSSPEAFIKQLQNMYERRGSVDLMDLEEAKEIAKSLQTTGKLTKLLSLLSQLKKEKPGNWRAVIFTGRKETQRKIGEFLKQNLGDYCVGFIQGGQPQANQRSIENYSIDPPSVNVIISTDAGAEGVNLQKGNVIVNYDLPWNPMIVEQRIGRVQRLGSNHAKVLVLNLVLANSVEERIVGRLSQKLSAIAHTIGDLEGVLESLDSRNDSADSFQKRILTLVRDTLAGRNVEKAIAMQEASIEKAQQIYEKEKETVEKRLGRLDAMHEDGPRMPELQEIKPRMTEREFSTQALLTTGNPFVQIDKNIFVHQIPGHAPEQVHFSRESFDSRRQTGFAGGPRANLYLSGQPAFEQLVGKWSGESAHCIYDLRALRERSIANTVESWASSFGPDFELVDFEVKLAKEFIKGELTSRVATSVAHDKYEKLISAPFSSFPLEVEPEINDEAKISEKDFYPNDIEGSIQERIASSAKKDPDIHSFNSFYLKRLKEEKEKAPTAELKRLAKMSFTPSVSLNLVGIKGHLLQLVEVTTNYTISDNGPFHSRITMFAHNGQLVSHPSEEICSQTRLRVPVDALGNCAVTNSRALKHLMLSSELSGKTALQHLFVKCEESDRNLLMSETAECSVTGKRVGQDLVRQSDMSDMLALKAELIQCSFSRAYILPSEAKFSDISGEPYRNDQTAICPISQQTGHRDEFTRCIVSSQLCAPSEIDYSDLSKRPCQKGLLVRSEKNSKRKGLPSEIVICKLTGKNLLLDEVEKSAVSGLRADRDLMKRSSKSGQWALSNEVSLCDESGALLLPSEGSRCAVSGKFVDRALLETSSISGKKALPVHFKPSSLSGTRALQSELSECETTGQMALPTELDQCIATGKRVIPSELVVSNDPSGKILRSLAVFSEYSGNACLSGRETNCQWTGTITLPKELWRCKITGLSVVKNCLDRKDEIGGIRRFMANEQTGVQMRIEELDGLDLGILEPIKKISGIRMMANAPDQVLVVAARRVGFLGFGSKALLQIYSRGGDIIYSS